MTKNKFHYKIFYFLSLISFVLIITHTSLFLKYCLIHNHDRLLNIDLICTRILIAMHMKMRIFHSHLTCSLIIEFPSSSLAHSCTIIFYCNSESEKTRQTYCKDNHGCCLRSRRSDHHSGCFLAAAVVIQRSVCVYSSLGKKKKLNWCNDWIA